MNRTPISSLDALRTCHQGERESVFILSSLLNGQPIIHIIGLNLITRPPEPYETMPSMMPAMMTNAGSWKGKTTGAYGFPVIFICTQ